MQWKRRHCCSYINTLFYALSFLGVLMFLVFQTRLTRSTTVAWFHGTKAKLNRTGQLLPRRLIIIPHTAVGNDSNVSSRNKDGVASARGVVNNLAVSRNEGSSLTPGPFRYIINEPDKCSDSEQVHFLVMLVTTEARQVEARNAIRQTWGNESVAPTLGIVRLFLLGTKSGELGLAQQKMVEAESKRHHDIIQQDFVDTYNNLTLKTLMGLNWVAFYCPQASYVLKTDTDVFVNTEFLIYHLLRPEVKPRTNYFTGSYMADFSPNRNTNSKWFMSVEEYPGARYPTFCSGTGYTFSGDLAAKIYQVSLNEPLLHLEDVFMGICLAKLGLAPIRPGNSFLFNTWRVPYSSCKYSHLITSHGFHPNDILKYWHHLQSTKHNACSPPVKKRPGIRSRSIKLGRRERGE